MPTEAFDEILGLEEQFYNDGFQQGLADGTKAGRIEGRTFGLEKGFEKYVDCGRLDGKTLIWANRISQFQKTTIQTPTEQTFETAQSATIQTPTSQKLPSLPNNQRLIKHLKVLHALAESESLSTENTEEAVSDFDDRFRRAQAKAKIIERMTGEANEDVGKAPKVFKRGDDNIEDASIGPILN